MRLLHTKELSLHSFHEGDVPPYAILSHTWEKEEVTLEDLVSNPNVTSMAGYQKIVASCRVAAGLRYEYIWIDTCCIDKSSSAEISEAINSMFRWYEKSSFCIAFLEDVLWPSAHHYSYVKEKNKHPREVEKFEIWFILSRWLTRGWTLQELIAPGTLSFYDSRWRRIDTKENLPGLISFSTGISEEVIVKSVRLEDVSVAQKMHWASSRRTTRSEDLAYCLMGLFDINMPLLYGEGGKKAFLRLQQESLKSTDDHSIFLWRLPIGKSVQRKYWGLLAESPAWFANSGGITTTMHCHNDDDLVISPTMTNRGLAVKLSGVHLKQHSPGVHDVLLLPECDLADGTPAGIIVRSGFGKGQYARIMVGLTICVKSNQLVINGAEEDGIYQNDRDTVREVSGTRIDRQSMYQHQCHVKQDPRPMPQWQVRGFWYCAQLLKTLVLKPQASGTTLDPTVVRTSRSPGFSWNTPWVQSSHWPEIRPKDHFITIKEEDVFSHADTRTAKPQSIPLAALEIRLSIRRDRKVLDDKQLLLVVGADFEPQGSASTEPTITPSWSIERLPDSKERSWTWPRPIKANSTKVLIDESGGVFTWIHMDIRREEKNLRMWYLITLGVRTGDQPMWVDP